MISITTEKFISFFSRSPYFSGVLEWQSLAHVLWKKFSQTAHFQDRWNCECASLKVLTFLRLLVCDSWGALTAVGMQCKYSLTWFSCLYPVWRQLDPWNLSLISKKVKLENWLYRENIPLEFLECNTKLKRKIYMTFNLFPWRRKAVMYWSGWLRVKATFLCCKQIIFCTHLPSLSRGWWYSGSNAHMSASWTLPSCSLCVIPRRL